MRYATLNQDGTFNAYIQTRKNVLWDETHFCPVSALTYDERDLFGVVEVEDGTPPAVHPVTEYVITNNPALVNGVWTVQYAVGERSVADVKAMLKSQVDTEYEARMTAGIVYNGLPVRTDDRSVINIIGANRNANANRKNVIGGQPIIVSGQMAAAIETAITNYTDALGEKRYDLYVAINAAADLTALGQIDVAAGWPSNVY